LKVLTEAKVRAELPRSVQPEVYYVEPGYILSPAAREYLMGRQIKISNGPKPGETPETVIAADEVPPTSVAAPQQTADGARYVDYTTGACYFEKPVHMTVLYENVLVAKDHPQILFRGKVESLQAQIILDQAILAEQGGSQKLLDDLNDVVTILRNILRSHGLNQPLVVESIIGFTTDQLQERVKNPMQYYQLTEVGIPEYKRGTVYARLNQLYAQTREVEAAAITALHEGNQYTRSDILETLNRLSSAFRVMMFMQLAGEYQ
jgi:ethanolamine utilization cobalamin adenosyltransferase